MLMTVRLIASEREALMVPEISLVQRASQVFVFTINGDKLKCCRSPSVPAIAAG